MLDAKKCSKLAERGELEPVPISEQSFYKKMAEFAVPRRIVGIARGSNAGSAYTVGNIRRRPSFARDQRHRY